MAFHKHRTGKRLAACVIAAVMAVGMLAGIGFAPRRAFADALDVTDAKGKYYTDFRSYEEEQAYAAAHNVKIVEESIVLLKNRNNALPLSKDVKDITVFSSVNYVCALPSIRENTNMARAPMPYGIIYGGTGSGQGVGAFLSMDEEFARAGYNLNPEVKAVYESVDKIEVVSGGIGGSMTSRVEIGVGNIATPNIRSSYATFNGAFIATIARHAGEGSNLWARNLDTHADKTEHYLQLDDNERALLAEMKAMKAQYHAPIIYLLNTANPFEVAELEDDPDIDAILWVGYPGASGLKAVPEILSGEVNPSGRLVDLFAADFTNDPTWYNFVNEYDTAAAINAAHPVADEILTYRENNMEHEEGIYFGYKWYETAAADGVLEDIPGYNLAKADIPASKTGDVYYNRSTGVVYPFGYGLSYTEFEQSFVTVASDIETSVNAAQGLDAMIDVQVDVKNTGHVAGKEVVELYVHAPYTDGGIEKAEVQLVSFAKTKLLRPGETERVTLQVRLGDIASFDYNDANANGWKGWEIEAGSYDFRLQRNSHELIEQRTVTLAAHTADLDNDIDSANNTPLSEDNMWNSVDLAIDEGSMVLMTRATDAGTSGLVGKFPTWPDRLYSAVVQGLMTSSKFRGRPYTEFDDDPDDLWYKAVEDIPAGWTQRAEAYGVDAAPIQLKDMPGLDFDDTTSVLALGADTDVAAFDGKTPAEAWELFLNQLTYDEMKVYLTHMGFRTREIDSIGKRMALDNDGPAQLNYDGRRLTNTSAGTTYGNSGGRVGTFWACEVNIAATWNVELARGQGRLVGNEGLFANVNGWYGPGVQVHRSPFIGRNFEYYSQDALQGGLIAAAVVGGAQSKGLNCYLKHFAFLSLNSNDWEFADEQNIRENHFKGYEFPIKFGGCTGIMAVGALAVSANTSNYATNVQIAAGEWGFKGNIITDWYGNYAGYANFNQRTLVCGPLTGGSYSGTNVMSGYWDAAGRDGKGMVMENRKVVNNSITIVPEGEEIDAPNQWYWTRTSVMRSLWMAANTSSNYNGLDRKAVTNKTVEVKRNFNYVKDGLPTTAATNNHRLSAALDAGQAAEFGSSENYYAVTGGALPAGLSLDYRTGRLVGSTAANVGDTNVTVTVYGDGWYRVNYTLTVRVSDFLTPAAALNATVGAAFSTQFSQAEFTAGGRYEDLGAIQSIGNYSVQGAGVPGLTMANNGTLSGTPTTAGTYTVTVRLPVTYRVDGISTNRTANIDTTYTVVVNAAPDDTINFRIDGGILQYRVGAAGEWIDAALSESEIQGLIDASVSGLLNGAQVQALIDASVSGLLNGAQVQALIDASTSGYLTSSQIDTLIANFQTAEQVNTIIAANANGYLNDAETKGLIDAAMAGNLTEAQIQAMIDGSIQSGKGCKSSGSVIAAALFSLTACAFVFVVRKQF
ncbi:MAG: glycoside hydrolase family 3 C-terminal domain-containing protein [Clostridiales bacterium]|nr:glycoside hydrolase family 3 C-terminal domain-containing protein [Clostridiales bacterium]